jgi:glycosyltransferase involved in cell wall biosynthesis
MLVAGEGPERPKLATLAREVARCGVQISFLGTSDRIPELLNAFDVYVLPSINEGLSNSLLEAMATGLPVIASDVGGNPEVVHDGISGLLFAPGGVDQLSDHLLKLYARTRLREELGDAARRRIREEFSIESMVQTYKHLYRSLLPAAPTAQIEVEA